MTHDEDRQAAAAAWELEIERFGAGEMSPADETRFLARCESEPEHWRAAALACVEHRRLGGLLAARRTHGLTAARSGQSTSPAWNLPQRLFAMAAAVALVAIGTGVGFRLGRGPAAGPEAVAAPQPQPPIDPALAEQLATLTRPLLPEAAAAVLREAGIDVREEPVVYVVDSGNGERWAMPETKLELRLAKDRGPTP